MQFHFKLSPTERLILAYTQTKNLFPRFLITYRCLSQETNTYQSLYIQQANKVKLCWSLVETTGSKFLALY